ncbi:MAG: DUF3375 domain-containing protein [Corynebacterium sp.]|nr:DUF3375 domain-containing protein [Corynebacterium sp.]
MSIVARAISNRRLEEKSAILGLLRSPLMPVVLGFVAEHFPPSTKARLATEIYDLLDADLKMLRAEGFDLPHDPQTYITDWVKVGWLLRRPGTALTGETIEPSVTTLNALDAIERWQHPHSAISAARINSIAESLENLSRESDPDINTRLAHLEEQKEALEQLIADTERGYFEVLSATQISERIIDVLELAGTMPADFAQVRTELEDINRSLRRQLLEPEDSRGQVLDDIFRGVDVIAESDAGRRFRDFYGALLEHKKSTPIDDWVTSILKRDNARYLNPELTEQLRQLFQELESEGYQVNMLMTELSRSLRDYVRTQDFTENRRMLELLRETQALAGRAIEHQHLGPLVQLQTPLTQIGMNIHSINSLEMKNLGQEMVETLPAPLAEAHIDTDALFESVRASEIDFEELRGHITGSVADRGQATIGDVLQDYPATQGLASVVGLLYFAMANGTALESLETVTWDDNGTPMQAVITGWLFTHDNSL